ncbi:MAG: hypothetical protein EOO48_03705 [Flavobacterium sp.]|nr:MAG: hypothetical protein EOO48_03705 [Flavobacterium sp.]
MKASHLILAGIVVLFAACKEEKDKPKVIYDTNKSKAEKPAPRADTTSVAIADLPVQITGTNYLIHPIGDVRFDKTRSGSGSGSGDVSYTISNYNEFELTGYLRNLKFQQLGSDSLKVLTDQPILIQTASYLKPFADKSKTQLLVYTLADMDTNKDGKIDVEDIKSLYISTIGGEKFTKLSSDFEELIDWKVIETKDRLYFRTIEDTNKNGEFDNTDVLHYNYVDLLAKDWKVVPYSPL